MASGRIAGPNVAQSATGEQLAVGPPGPSGTNGTGSPGGGGGYNTIQIAGAAYPQETILNLVAGTGTTIAAADDSANNRTTVTITVTGAFVAGGDLGGTATNQVIEKIQGHPWPTPTGTNTFLQWSGTVLQWAAGPSGSFTAGGDLTGTASSQQVVSLTGASSVLPIAATANVLTWAAATTAPGMAQTIAASSANPQAMTFAPQAPNASAGTTAHGTPGNFVVQLAAPTSTGTEASFVIERVSTALVSIGALASKSNSPQIFFEGGAFLLADNTNGGSLSVAAPSAQAIYFYAGATLFAEMNGGALLFEGIHSLEYQAGSNSNLGSTGGTNTLNAAPHYFAVYAEGSNPSSTVTPNGGPLLLIGGAAANPGTTGTSGAVAMSLNGATGYRMVEAAEVATGSRAVALCQIGAGVTSTNIPNGDGVVWVAEAHANPSSAPTGGFLLWADSSTGAAYCCNPGGSPFALGAGGGGGATSVSGDVVGSISGSNIPTTVQIISGNGPGAYCTVACNSFIWNSGLTPSLSYSGVNAFSIVAGGALALQGAGAVSLYSTGSTATMQASGNVAVYSTAGTALLEGTGVAMVATGGTAGVTATGAVTVQSTGSTVTIEAQGNLVLETVGGGNIDLNATAGQLYVNCASVNWELLSQVNAIEAQTGYVIMAVGGTNYKFLTSDK